MKNIGTKIRKVRMKTRDFVSTRNRKPKFGTLFGLVLGPASFFF